MVPDKVSPLRARLILFFEGAAIYGFFLIEFVAMLLNCETACGNYALNDAIFSQSGNKNAVIVIFIVVIFYHQSQYHGFLNAANIRLLLKFLLCGDVRGSPLRRVASANSHVLVGSCV